MSGQVGLSFAEQLGGRASERLSLVLSAANDAFYVVDVESGRIAWTRGVQLLFGHDPEAIGPDLAAWQGFVHPDDLAGLNESGRAVVRAGGTAWSQEFRFARADGTYARVRARSFFVRDDGGTHVVGSLADLSELRTREDDLRAAEAELQKQVGLERVERRSAEMLLRSPATEVLGEWDLETGAIVVSPSVETVLGWKSEEVTDIDAVLRRAHPEDGSRVLEDLRRRIAQGADSWSATFRFHNREGDPVLMESRQYVIRNETGRAVRVVGSTRVLPAERPHPAGSPAGVVLTERQAEVLALIREGLTNKEIAGRLRISEQAAKVQASKLLRKFGVANRAALVAAADERDRVS